MLDDLRGKRKSTEFVTWGQVGAWFERYARRIDNLPILNVAPEMLDFGVVVADSLRQSETAMKGIGVRSGMRKTQLPNFYTTRTWATPVPVNRWRTAVAYDWSSKEDLAARGQAEARIRTQERSQGNANAHFIMRGIVQATSAVPRPMTQEYNVEF